MITRPPFAEAASPVFSNDEIVGAAADADDVPAYAEIATMQPPGGSGATRAAQPPSRGQRSSSPLALGAATARLGGPQGPQSAAPPFIGDRFGGGQSCLTIPVIRGTGTPFTTNVQAGPSSVPIQLQSDGSSPRFTSAPQPQFPSRTFMTVGDAAAANSTFQAGNNLPLQNQPAFNQDVQNALIAGNPAGTVLPTGQTAAGGGTATPQGMAAVLDPTKSPPQNGRGLRPGDFFFLRGSYLYVPNVVFGPQQPSTICINPAASGAAVVGLPKISENASPLPRDRVYFNYSMFDDTPLTAGGQTVHRFSPGFEKTFFDEMTSIEMRFPFAATINPDLRLTDSGITADEDTVFGNISTIFKALLDQTDEYAFSVGLQVTAPTAPSLNVSMIDGTRIVDVDNQSVHIMPFVGYIYTPNDRFFSQVFLQFDVDSNGNPVAINPTLQSLTPIGRLHDTTFMYVDLNIGYWIYRGGGDAGLTGIAPTAELHYNTSLEHSEFLESDGFVIGSSLNQISTLNLTLGCYFELAQDNSLVLGYTMPIGNGVDHEFDGELRAFFTHRFGTPTRASRVGI